MKVHLILLISLFVSMTELASGQVDWKRLSLVNPHTSQWLTVSSAGRNAGGLNITLCLMTKGDPVHTESISMTHTQLDHYVDSLKRNGWKDKVKYKSVSQKRFVPTIELGSIVTEDFGKSAAPVFRFIYKITLTDKRSGKVYCQMDTIMGDARDSVLIAFEKKDYFFGKILIQKETNIISLFVESTELFHPWKERDYPILGPVRAKAFYF